MEKLKGKNSIELTMVLASLGSTFASCKKFDQARKFYERCLQIQEESKGRESLDVAASLKSLGMLYHNQSNHAKALEYL